MHGCIPLTSTSASVDDGLGGLNGAEASGEGVEKLVISGGVKATDVDILVAWDAVLEALLESLHLARRSEDGRDSLGYGRVLLQDLEEGRLRDGNSERLGGVVEANRLRGRRVVGGTVVNTRTSLTMGEASPVGSTGSASGLAGGVRVATVVETGDELGLAAFNATRLKAVAAMVVGDNVHGNAHVVVRSGGKSASITLALDDVVVLVVGASHTSDPRTTRTNRHRVAHVDAVNVAVEAHATETIDEAGVNVTDAGKGTVGVVDVRVLVGALGVGSAVAIVVGRAATVGAGVGAVVAVHFHG